MNKEAQLKLEYLIYEDRVLLSIAELKAFLTKNTSAVLESQIGVDTYALPTWEDFSTHLKEQLEMIDSFPL
jgi:hypothetical protein